MCSSSCHSALRDVLCLFVRKASLRLASASLGRPSQPSAVTFRRPVTRPDTHHSSRELERHQAPSPRAQDAWRSRRLSAPLWCPPSSRQLPAPKPISPPPEQTPSSQGILFSTLRCLRVRCEDWRRRGEAANQLGNPDCILITNAKHPRAAICSNGKNQQVPGV